MSIRIDDHEGTKAFQAQFKHLSSSPLTVPSLLASHLGSSRPKTVQMFAALMAESSLRLLLESSLLFKSALRALPKVASANTPASLKITSNLQFSFNGLSDLRACLWGELVLGSPLGHGGGGETEDGN